jgi:Xaa-Pro aminopeptidase
MTHRNRQLRRRFCTLAVIAALAVAIPGDASEFSDDLAARRARVMEAIGPDTMLILWAAPTARFSNDVDYVYRQDANLYYLTGIAQPDTMLVLMPGNETARDILFIKERNPAQEHWTGRVLSVDEARARSGIQTVFPSTQFEPFVTALLARRGFGTVGAKQAARFFEALSEGRARLSLVLDPDRRADDPLIPPLEFARRIRDRFVGFTMTDATKSIADQRLIKTPYERALLGRAGEISTDAHVAGVRAARPGAFEYEVKAAIEAVHYSRGASLRGTGRIRVEVRDRAAQLPRLTVPAPWTSRTAACSSSTGSPTRGAPTR